MIISGFNMITGLIVDLDDTANDLAVIEEIITRDADTEQTVAKIVRMSGWSRVHNTTEVLPESITHEMMILNYVTDYKIIGTVIPEHLNDLDETIESVKIIFN